MIIEKFDRAILRLYMELPFPSVLYEEEYEYITSLDSLLHGYCQRLLDNIPIKDYIPSEREELLIKQEFTKAIKTSENAYELSRYYNIYVLVKDVLKNYVE
jgi:hypothetical protein